MILEICARSPAPHYNAFMSSPSDGTPNPQQPAEPDETMPPEAPAVPSEPSPPIPFNIGEEFSAPSKKLPPIRIVLICIAAVAAIVGIYSFVQRPQAQASGSIDTVTAVDLPGQHSVIVAMNVSVRNTGEKTFYIRNIQAEVQCGNDAFSDNPLAAVDFDRYYQAFPDLKKAPLDPLRVEQKIAPGGTLRGTIVVIFPLPAEAFANRKGLKVTIQPYDQPVSLVITK